MSRYVDRIEEGKYKTEIESMELCKWRYNEVCCNSKSEYLADFPPIYLCDNNKYCKYFEKEDGIIKETIKEE